LGQKNNFPPDSITYPNQYNGQVHLNIACTQRSTLTPTQQKNLVKEWAEFLPSCKEVKIIWFTTTMPQAIFDSVCCLDNLLGLNIKNSSVKYLDNISKLIRLKYLRIGDSPKIESIQPLTKMKNLEVLTIENFKDISDFTTLKSLSNLKFLTIEGGMSKKQNIDNFDFLTDLTDLIYFSTTMISSTNQSFDKLFDLKKLRTLNWPFELTQTDIQKLSHELPNLKYLPDRHRQKNMDKIKSLLR